MRFPGTGAGERRIEENSSLSTVRLPNRLNLALNERDKYWWSWRRIRYLASYIKDHGIETPAQWNRFAAICHIVSESKKDYLYSEIKNQFSESSLEYLFGSDYIARKTRSCVVIA